MERLKEEYMNDIKQATDIEEIQQLLEQLKIIEEENKQIQEVKPVEQKENEEVILNYSSSETDNEEETRVKISAGESSNINKRKYNEYSSWNNFENETMHEKGYARRDGKWQKVPEEFKPRHQEMGRSNILNLDCVSNKEDVLKQWSNEMLLLIVTDEKFSTLNAMDIKNFLMYKTIGNVQKYLTSIDDLSWASILGSASYSTEAIEIIMGLIHQEFIGYNIFENKEKSNIFLHEKAVAHLNQMQICNMCEIEKFICEYQKYYYQINNQTKEIYKEIFIDKLPYPLNAEIKRIWNEKPTETANTLGGIIQVVYNTLRENCLKRETIRQLNRGSNALCCNIPELEIPGKYGCEKPTRRNYRRNKPRIRRVNPRKKAYRNNNKKYFRKKKQTPRKYCPKGKKNCECWLCNDEGHYANECPKKNENKKKLKL